MCSCVILVWNPFDTGVLGLVLHTHIHSLIFVSQSPVCTRHVHGYVKQGETSLSHPNCLAVTPPGWSLVLLWTFTITAGTHPVGVCHQLRGGQVVAPTYTISHELHDQPPQHTRVRAHTPHADCESFSRRRDWKKKKRDTPESFQRFQILICKV